MLNPPIIFLDMDETLFNFMEYYLDLGNKIGNPVQKPYSDTTKNKPLFEDAVLNHQIFEHLNLLEDAPLLLAYLKEIENHHQIEIQMLSSVNSVVPRIIEAGINQKTKSLNKHNIYWKPNFVRNNYEKSTFANKKTILIDDNPACINPFNNKGGLGILYKGFNDHFVKDFESKLFKILNLS